MIRSIAYTSPFIPAEWIAGHGFNPLRISGECASSSGIEGVCAFAQGLAQWTKSKQADAVIIATTCDQMRRCAEQVDPAITMFLLNVPATQTAESLDLYHSEIHRLGKFLESLGGTAPSSSLLAGIVRQYESRRNRTWQNPANSAIRIGLIGGPMRQQDQWIFQQVEAAGGQVVLDATETGERNWPLAFNESKLQADPLQELVRCYFHGNPDAFRRPDTALHEYLQQEVRRRKIAGLLLVRFVCCDLWHAELHRLKESLGIPVVQIELGEEGDRQRLATRIESLVGILK